MKQIITTMLLCFGTMCSFAYDTAVEGTTYYGSNCAAYGLSDGTVAINTYYTSEGQTEVTFPATIKVMDGETVTAEYEVSAVGVAGWNNIYLGSASTYQYAGPVTSLVFSEGIKTINASAFYEMASLTNVSLPSTLTTIGDYAFNSCDALKKITSLSAAVAIGTDALKGKGSWDTITSCCTLVVPDGCTANYAAYSLDNTKTWTYWDQFYSCHNIREADSFTIGTTGYATYFNTYGYTMPEGVEGYIIYDAENGTAKIEKIYNEGETVCDNMGLLLKSKSNLSESKTFNVEVLSSGGNTATWPMKNEAEYYTNLINGVQTTQVFTGYNGSYYYYKLANDENGLGWYWGAADGGVFELEAHHCYMSLLQETERAKSFMPFIDGSTAGINSLNASRQETSGDIYNLHGMRVGKDYKGLVIKNGRKYFNR